MFQGTRVSILTGMLPTLFSFVFALQVWAAECLSPSYSVQKGRNYLEGVESRNLMGHEYQDLKELFQGLIGSWTGSGLAVRCEGPEEAIRKEIENYTINSTIKYDSYGQFALESKLYCPEKRTGTNEAIRLYLNDRRLATDDISISDIELISASRDELTFVTKNRARGDGGVFMGREWMISIRKIAAASLVVENTLFVNGRYTASTVWELDRE